MKTPLQNDRLLRALRREPLDRTPVWFMRQAGRYLPEYRATREKAGDFMSLCRNPELCCEVTLQPIERFDLDAAILFSDILTVPDAMGLGLSFAEGEGPRFARPIRDPREIAQLAVPDPNQELRYVMDAVATIKGALGDRIPLIGFAGSPWTLATYMIEGGSSKDFARAKALMYDQPDAMEALLAKLSAATSLYLQAQIEHGADAVMIFDTWGGALTPETYLNYSLEPMAKIVTHLKRVAPTVPVVLFTKGGGQHLEKMVETGCDGLGLDWTSDLAQARARVGAQVALQGNLDPAVLYASPERIRLEVARVLQAYGNGSGHVFNLGHGITPGVNPEHAAAMVAAVREFSPAYHR
jgi:uroporphyrinogen decarboxylase